MRDLNLVSKKSLALRGANRNKKNSFLFLTALKRKTDNPKRNFRIIRQVLNILFSLIAMKNS